MRKARRTAARSSGRKRKSRSWLWLIVGVTLGAGLMYASQVYVYKDGKPFAGLSHLFQNARKAVEKATDKEARPVEAEKPSKPKLDFYTILPGETVLPEPQRDDAKKAARTEPAEKGVSYMLQAAAFANVDDADRLKARLVLNGLEPHIEKITAGDKGTVYRVRLGPYSNLDALDASNAKLTKLGIKAIRIKVKKSTG
jgi:cell division protein FtsN